MKKLVKDRVTAKTWVQENKSVFSMEDIFALLSNMQELEQYDINIKPGRAGTCIIEVDDSVYTLSSNMQDVLGK
jgi:hypothetical protein